MVDLTGITLKAKEVIGSVTFTSAKKFARAVLEKDEHNLMSGGHGLLLPL